MAKRARTRARPAGRTRTQDGPSRGDWLAPDVVPRVLVGAVNAAEVVAVSALRLSRDVLMMAVSGAANVGAEAVTATMAGARGVVSAASAMVRDIAGAAETTLRDVIVAARNGRSGAGAVALRRPAAIMTARGETMEASTEATRARRRTRRPVQAAKPRAVAA